MAPRRTGSTVPADTLTGIDSARQLGIASLHDLLGGVVPYDFVGTKAISHGLVSPDARAPEGWSHAFGPRIAPYVLARLHRVLGGGCPARRAGHAGRGQGACG